MTQAETIANIQKLLKSKSKLSLWDSSLLYQWLKDKSPTDTQYVCMSVFLFAYLKVSLSVCVIIIIGQFVV